MKGLFTVSGVILAGGKSSRMGTDKALLQIGEGMTIIAHIAQTLQELCKEVLVSVHEKKYDLPNVVYVEDVYPDCGPMSGIHAALMSARYDRVLCCACDMPYITKEVGERLIERSHDFDAVVARVAGRWQPLFAVYSRSCLPIIEEQLRQGHYKMENLLNKLNVRVVTEEEIGITTTDVFFNVNRPADYEIIKKQKHLK